MQDIGQQLFQLSPQAIMVTDLDNKIVQTNGAFEKITGYSFNEVIGENPRMLGAGQMNDSFYEELWSSLQKSGQWAGELWNRHKDGSVYPAWFNILSIADDSGKATGYIAQFFNISEIKADLQSATKQNTHDELTHLPNWDYFSAQLDQKIQQCEENQKQLAVMLVDLDRFKWINDNLGRNVGDNILQKVANRLSTVVPEKDAVARLSSDEFVIMLPEVSGIDDATTVAQKVVEQLAQGIFVDHREIFISGSVGIALSPDHSVRAKELVKKADVAMYAAKQGGRNTYRVYSDLMERSKGPQILREEDLTKALVSGDVQMAFLPIYSLYSHKVVAVHARPYWNHAELGQIPFSDFSGLMQSKDAIDVYEQWLHQELSSLSLVWESFPGLRFISFRMEAQQLQNKSAIQRWVSQLTQYQLIGRMMLDVDIRTALEREGALFDLLATDAMLSVSGFAHQSPVLDQLKDIHPDIIRLDSDLITHMSSDEGRQKIVDVVMDLADRLEIEVMADGVASAGQRGDLMGQGCMLMQGRYFGMPLTLEQLMDHLAVEH
ncbi:MAG: diguanylate cyclase domain-containing protein [Neptuniibacter sp.]